MKVFRLCNGLALMSPFNQENVMKWRLVTKHSCQGLFLKDSITSVNESNIIEMNIDVISIKNNSIFFKRNSMNKTKINHPERAAFVTGAYSDGVLIDGLLFISGQAPVDFQTSKFILGTIEEETRRTLENIKSILEAAGATMDNVVKCTVHLRDIKEFDRYNEVYATYFPGIKPARTTVQSVLAEGIKVEIDCIAVVATQS